MGRSSPLAVCVLAIRLAGLGEREANLPPGPPTVPILGNAAQIPRQDAYLRFTEWAKEYGEIYSLKILSSTMIILTDPAAITELLDKRNATSSDRPTMFLVEIVTEGLHIALTPHREIWKLFRRCTNEILSPTESRKHLPIQIAETTQLLDDLLKTPEDFYRHVARYTNSIVMSVTYGIRTPRLGTKHAENFYEMEDRWLTLLAPGAHPPLDIVPLLRHVPERWASWKTESREVRRLQRDLFFKLLSGAEDRIQRGEENNSFMESVLKRQDDLKMDRDQVGYLGGGVIEGGTETVSAFLRTLIQMLVENPEVVRKARAELDQIIDETRIPTIEDASNLPYIQAIIKETHRFRPVSPLALPHALSSDEIYLNYYLPKGATILFNLWGIFHDPEIFERPEEFLPDRYIESEYGVKLGYKGLPPRSTLIFGAGRRLCPGMYVAVNTLLLAVMSLIWAFDFQRPLDADRKPIPLDLNDCFSRLTLQPRPFNCRIVPRSQARADLIEANFSEAREMLAKFEDGLDSADS